MHCFPLIESKRSFLITSFQICVSNVYLICQSDHYNTKIGPFLIAIIQGFPQIDHSASSARIVLEQHKFSKKVTSNWD